MSEMTTTIEVKRDTHTRLDWYKDKFGKSFDDVISFMMDKLGLASAEAIDEHKKNFSDKFGSEKEAAIAGAPA